MRGREAWARGRILVLTIPPSGWSTNKTVKLSLTVLLRCRDPPTTLHLRTGNRHFSCCGILSKRSSAVVGFPVTLSFEGTKTKVFFIPDQAPASFSCCCMLYVRRGHLEMLALFSATGSQLRKPALEQHPDSRNLRSRALVSGGEDLRR